MMNFNIDSDYIFTFSMFGGVYGFGSWAQKVTIGGRFMGFGEFWCIIFRATRVGGKKVASEQALSPSCPHVVSNCHE